jgi:antibiotic biosynthesis monooxygenase (ABM) superfamily enzyme
VGVEYADTDGPSRATVVPEIRNRVEKDCSLTPCRRMDKPIHIAITLRVRKTHVGEFERALADFARRSLAEPGARGVQCLYPPPGSSSTEYGIMRSFASAADRDAFYRTTFFKDWLARIEPMVEGESTRRQLDGLEAWFRDPKGTMPPRWKMALLTWIAVWLASMLMRAILAPALGPNFPQVLSAGLVAAGVVVILTWVAMPLLVKIARPWLHPKNKSSRAS